MAKLSLNTDQLSRLILWLRTTKSDKVIEWFTVIRSMLFSLKKHTAEMLSELSDYDGDDFLAILDENPGQFIVIFGRQKLVIIELETKGRQYLVSTNECPIFHKHMDKIYKDFLTH